MFRKEPEPDFQPVVDETINIYSSTVLPRTNFNDPKAIHNMINAFHQDKIGIDDMSVSINKLPIDPKLIIAMAIFIPIGLMMLWGGVISPTIQAENQYKLQLAKVGGNSTVLENQGIERPPGLAEVFKLPGFNRPS